MLLGATCPSQLQFHVLEKGDCKIWSTTEKVLGQKYAASPWWGGSTGLFLHQHEHCCQDNAIPSLQGLKFLVFCGPYRWLPTLQGASELLWEDAGDECCPWVHQSTCLMLCIPSYIWHDTPKEGMVTEVPVKWVVQYVAIYETKNVFYFLFYHSTANLLVIRTTKVYFIAFILFGAINETLSALMTTMTFLDRVIATLAHLLLSHALMDEFGYVNNLYII